MNTRTLDTRLEAFVKSGFKRSKFTNDIYEALSVHSGKFIAHFDRDGFYKARFESREGLSETLKALKALKPTDEVKRLIRYMAYKYDEYQQTYKIGEPIFRVVGDKIGVFYDSNTKWDTVLNLTGYPDAYLSKGAGIYKTFIEMTRTPILTNSDSIAYDWILNLPDQGERVSKDRLIILVHTGTKDGHCGASELRLKNAQAKLKSLGYKTKYCKDLATAKRFIESIKILGCAS